jgi:hypothetical protein
MSEEMPMMTTELSGTEETPEQAEVRELFVSHLLQMRDARTRYEELGGDVNVLAVLIVQGMQE